MVAARKVQDLVHSVALRPTRAPCRRRAGGGAVKNVMAVATGACDGPALRLERARRVDHDAGSPR